jgi:hypothetical protein
VSLFRKLAWVAGVGVLAGTLGTHTWAQTAPAPAARAATGPRSWASLTPAQQTALQPLQREWNSIDLQRKNKWIEVANRFSTLPPAEQARIQGRMAEWADLSPKERGQTRLNFQEARRIPAEDRKAKWELYQALPPEQRQELAARAVPASAPSNGKFHPPTQTGKLNTVPSSADATRPRAVSPTLAQAQPGATTTLLTRRNGLPEHQKEGQPKIVTSARLVDNTTLLPKGLPGAAAPTAPPASAAAASRP